MAQIQVGMWVRHASTWERVHNNRPRRRGKAGKDQKIIVVSDVIRAEVTKVGLEWSQAGECLGTYVFCTDVDGYECPSREVRPDFPEHLRWHYPQYRLPMVDCVEIPVDENARKLKQERAKLCV